VTASEETASRIPLRIVSGGQTGVDRGALDAAVALGIECGGWCPRGRLAEDGRIPRRYPLVECETSDYPVRTERNILDSDATLILCRGPLSGGTKLTRDLARRRGKPCLVVDLAYPTDAQRVRDWLVDFQVETLNVAGPRESLSAGISRQASKFLVDLLTPGE
jgi:hypothetical protein